MLDYLVNQAGKAGIMSLFAASNSGVDTATTWTSSSVDLQSPYAIVVASDNADATLSSFSNYNATAVDVAAPGGSMMSTVRMTDATTVIGAEQFQYDVTTALLAGKNLRTTASRWAACSMMQASLFPALPSNCCMPQIKPPGRMHRQLTSRFFHMRDMRAILTAESRS